MPSKRVATRSAILARISLLLAVAGTWPTTAEGQTAPTTAALSQTAPTTAALSQAAPTTAAQGQTAPTTAAQGQTASTTAALSQTAPTTAAAETRTGPPLQYRSVKQAGWPTALEVPVGFTVEEVGAGLTSPRFMALDSDGSLVFGSHTAGKVVRLRDTRHTGQFDLQQEVASNLTYVHSVVFVDGKLYATAEDRVVLLDAFGPDGRAGIVQTIVDDLPAGARDLYGHRTRMLLLGPDHKVYLRIGSACDVCEDDNPMRAVVLRMDPDGTNMQVVATGLRNPSASPFARKRTRPSCGATTWAATTSARTFRRTSST